MRRHLLAQEAGDPIRIGREYGVRIIPDGERRMMGGSATLSPTMLEFEQRLRRRVDDRIAGKEDARQDYADVDPTKLTLVDTSAMDESVVTGNITRVVENQCHDELQVLNRGFGHLMGQPELETDRNPLAPVTIVDAFAAALKQSKLDQRIRFTILKELNQAPLGEIAAIYADLNRHLINQHVVPAGARASIINRSSAVDRTRALRAQQSPAAHPPASPEIDVMALFRRMSGGAPAPALPGGQAAGQPVPGGQGATDVAHPAGGPRAYAMPEGGDGLPQIEMPGGARSMWIPAGPLAPTPSGYIPGTPIIATPELGEGLHRLQRGEMDFDVGGAMVQFSGIPEGLSLIHI